MNGRHFRAGVGAVIYNQDGAVVLWRRATPPTGTWQFQQGGIDAGEEPQQTLWRELTEETGLTEADFATVTEFPDWTLQVYPPEILHQPDQPNPDRLGQVHRWWLLELKPGVAINLDTASDDEFDDYRFVTWEEAITTATSYKAAIYQKLYSYYQNHIAT